MLSSTNFKRFYHCCTRGCCARTSRSTVYLAPKTQKSLQKFGYVFIFFGVSPTKQFFWWKPRFWYMQHAPKMLKIRKMKNQFRFSTSVLRYKHINFGVWESGGHFLGTLRTDGRTDVTDRTSGHLSSISHIYLVIHLD